MKLTTLRNLMASMLVVGVAGSVIGVGSGTFALFNATTTNPSNTFTTGDIVFKDNGGSTTCTAQSSTTPTNSVCDTLLTLGKIVPGDTVLNASTPLTLTHDATSSVPAVTISFTSADHGSSDAALKANLDTSTSSGLGLLVFRCTTAASTTVDQGCSTNQTQLVPIVGTCSGGNPITSSSSGFAAGQVVAPANTNDNTRTIGVGAGSTAKSCTGGNIIQGTAIPVGGPDTNQSTASVNAGHAVHIAIMVWLPGQDDNTVAGKSASIDFTWKAESILGQAFDTGAK